jgi:glycosyltransferase involved in cell wall biosynthesis
MCHAPELPETGTAPRPLDFSQPGRPEIREAVMTVALGTELSVVIPAYNASLTVGALLKTLCSPEAGGPVVIVVNDGSTDSTRDCLGCFPVRVLDSSRNLGIAISRNRGWRAAVTPYVAFVDADCAVGPEWPRQLLVEFQAWQAKDSRVAAMSGRVLPYAEHFCDRLSASIEHWEYQGGIPEERLKLTTSNCICDYRILEKAGGFDERLLVDEDRELALRLATLGYKTAYHPGVSVLHHHNRQTVSAIIRHQYYWGRCTGLLNEWRYQGIRNLWFLKYIRNPWIYFISVPWMAVALTGRIIHRMFPQDWKVLGLAPWIFAAKLAYRYGVFAWLRQPRNLEKI